MEETLKGILVELHQISVNTDKSFFDNSMFSTVLGAIIAAIFGVITTVFLEWRKERKERIVAIRTICSELELSLNAFEIYRFPMIEEKTGLPYVKEWVIIPPILEKDSLEKYKPNIIKVLNEEDMRYIDDVYINFKRLDKVMAEVVKLREQFILHQDNQQLAKETEDRMKVFWMMALSPESKNLIENGRKALKSLKSIK